MITKNIRERYGKRKQRIRRKIQGNATRPRLTVTRTLKHIYVQLIDDASGRTLLSTSTVAKDLREQAKATGSRKELGKLVGKNIAKLALEQNIKEVVFDRNGFLYHGRVSAVAEGAREGGLKF